MGCRATWVDIYSGRASRLPEPTERSLAASDPIEREARAHAYENPRPEVQALVPLGARRILDLGCSSGALGAALKERQRATVIGMEREPAYAADAGTRLDQLIEGDIEQLLADDGVRSMLGTFDCLIAADVLEHLRDPWSALAAAASLLEPGGDAVVSLPNVRYWETFYQLGVRGTWPRRATGIFDRSHLRWFALRDARTLLRQAGLDVVSIHPQYRLKPGDWRSEPGGRLFHWTPLRPFFVFQYVLHGAARPQPAVNRSSRTPGWPSR